MAAVVAVVLERGSGSVVVETHLVVRVEVASDAAVQTGRGRDQQRNY